MELYVKLVSLTVYALIALAFWVDDDEVDRRGDRALHALACLVWPLVVVFALAAVAGDAALALFRGRR